MTKFYHKFSSSSTTLIITEAFLLLCYCQSYQQYIPYKTDSLLKVETFQNEAASLPVLSLQICKGNRWVIFSEEFNLIICQSLADHINSNKQMTQAVQLKKLTRDANFFEPTRFKPFHADIGTLKMPIKPEAIQELYLKCYGYGYFEEHSKSIQTQLKQNFIAYLQAALQECHKLKILKIEFSGFSIADKSLVKVISLLQRLIEKRDIEILWFHTRLLRESNPEIISEMLSIADRLIGKNRVQEISLQISGWEFVKGPPSYGDLLNRFSDFAKELMEMGGGQNIKRLKLDLSSLYVSQLQAYNFLEEAIQVKRLIEMIENAKFSQERKQNPVPESRLKEWRDKIQHYLKNINKKFETEHPIPGKNKYISREPEYQRRKKEYIYGLIKDRSKEELLKVFNEERGMPEEHKQRLKHIRQQVDQEMQKQAKQIQESQELIEQTNEIEKQIGQTFEKFPFDFVIAQRVQEFHKIMKMFVNELTNKLTKLEQFELDMRNWNPLFQTGELKKTLVKEFSQGGVRPILNQGSKIVPKNIKEDAQEQTPQLNCKFIM